MISLSKNSALILKLKHKDMIIHTERIDKVALELERQAKLVKAFRDERVQILRDYQPKIENFLKEADAYGILVGNMYSSGCMDKDYYTDDARLIAHCTFYLRRPYKNFDRLKKTLQAKWNTFVTQKDGLISGEVRVIQPGNDLDDIKVNLQIWIKKS